MTQLVIHQSTTPSRFPEFGSTKGPVSKLETALIRARQDSTKNERAILALFNGSGLSKRPLTNLNNDETFKLPKGPKSGLVAFTSMSPKAYRDDQIWACVVTEMLEPEHAQASPRDLKTIRRKRGKLLMYQGASYTGGACGVATRVRKDKNTFTVVIPIAATKRRDGSGIWAANFYELVTMNPAYTARGQGGMSQQVVDDANGGDVDELPSADEGTGADNSNQFVPKEPAAFPTNATIHTSQLKLANLSPKIAGTIKALNATLSLEDRGPFVTLLATFTVDRASAEYLCNNKFDEIRTVDMYGLARAWAQGKRDTSLVPPRSTKPLADIAASMPAGGTKKTDNDGILVTHLAELFYVPEKVNNVKVYDSALAIALSSDDGFMTQLPQGATQAKKMPPSHQVLVDWVNSKWSYVSDSGNLQVMDLSRSQPLNVSHVKKFLATPITADIAGFVTIISRCQGIAGIPKLDGTVVNKMFDTIQQLVTELFDDLPADKITVCKLYYINELAKYYLKTKDDRCKPFRDLLDLCGFFSNAVMQGDPTNLYKEYGVTTVSNAAALGHILYKYGNDYDEVHLKDREQRAKYTAPMVDPKWVLPALPYLAADRGLMPHQNKASNMLRDSPDNAILQVDAGGGKTSILVTDILKEMQNGVKGPFLVMCPAHLVAQYVIEFSYFTESRINTVPVTTYSLRQHGYAGLEAMIDAAPINTVVLADYNLAKGASKCKNVGYGTSSVQVFPVVEFLRQFHFQYVGMDESHFLKNTNSTQSEAVAQLVNGIKKKRLASGTFMANSPSDIAGQFAMLDPTVFGTVDQFNVKYSESHKPGKIKQFAEGAELEIKKLMSDNSRLVMIGRKEWAAILPRRIESFNHIVNLSPEQRRIYNMVLANAIEEIKKAAATNEKLSIALGITQVSSEDKEEMMDEIDSDTHSSMEGGLDELLRPYLARLESFINAPDMDPLGNLELKGEDRISPKVAELVDIYLEHKGNKIPGKILVFTNQKADAQHIYQNLPDAIKSRTLLYLATDKEAAGAEFERNAELDMMIGVGSSMEVGLNLQFCSRLVRVSAVLSPASLEQGNARIGRPNVKVAETRSATYFDWLIADSSIDQTKVAYLLTKKVRIASVAEAGNPNYRGLEIPELFSLNLETIAGMNTSETLEEYVGPDGMYRNFLDCQTRDYNEFKEQNKHLLDETGKMKMLKLSRSANLEGSAIMRRIPYVPGVSIYGTRDLGLVRVDDYLREDAAAASANDEDEEDDESAVDTTGLDDKQARQATFRASVEGLNVHTDKGEGEVVGGSAKANRLRVRLNSGELVNVKTMSAYVITRKQTSGKDIRGHLAKMAGDIPIDTPYDVKSARSKVVPAAKDTAGNAKGKDKKGQKEALSMNLDLVVTNDFLALQLDNPDDNKEAKNVLKLLKFAEPDPYVFAKLDTPERFLKLARTMKAAGFSLPKGVAVGLEAFYNAWRAMRSNARTMFGQATNASLKNFYILQHKANPNKKEITAYIMVEDETVYICMPMRGFPGNKEFVTKHPVTGVKFRQAVPQLLRHFNTPKELTAFISSLKSSGINISNEEKLYKDVVGLHKVVQRVTKQEANDWYSGVE